MRTKKISIITVAALALVCSACHKQQQPTLIKVQMEPTTVRTDTAALPTTDVQRHFTWGSDGCDVNIHCQTDPAQPIVSDSDGNKYYDNTVHVALRDATGTIYDHIFHKADFNQFITNNYLQPTHCALLSIAFRGVDDDRAILVATLGSPDEMDDEFALVEVRIAKSGTMTMAQVEELE